EKVDKCDIEKSIIKEYLINYKPKNFNFKINNELKFKEKELNERINELNNLNINKNENIIEKLNILETKLDNLKHKLESKTGKLNVLNESINDLKIRNDNINYMLNNDTDLNDLIKIKFMHFKEILTENEFNKIKNIKN
ncbi:unnamed protein product, partial [Didymodactylos carnosus]